MKEPHEFTAEDIARDLYGFVRKRILAEDADFSLDSSLESIGIDSVSLLEILLYLERQYNIYIPDEKLTPDNIATINKLAETSCSSVLNHDAGS